LKEGASRIDYRIWADNIQNYCRLGEHALLDATGDLLTGRALKHAFGIRSKNVNITGEQLLLDLETLIYGPQTLDDVKADLQKLRWDGTCNPTLYITEMEDAMKLIADLPKLEQAAFLVNGCKGLSCYEELLKKLNRYQLERKTQEEIYLKITQAISCERPSIVKKVTFVNEEVKREEEIAELQKLRLEVHNLLQERKKETTQPTYQQLQMQQPRQLSPHQPAQQKPGFKKPWHQNSSRPPYYNNKNNNNYNNNNNKFQNCKQPQPYWKQKMQFLQPNWAQNR
jgi:hypothetical protein